MRLTADQRNAISKAINAIDAITFSRVATLEELVDYCEGFGGVSDLLFEVLAQDEAEEETPTAYDYDADAVRTIKQVIASRPEFDINELLYNAEDVADRVDDIIFDEVADVWESEFDALDEEGQKLANEEARQKFADKLDLVAFVVGETCNENNYLDWLADGEYYHIHWMMRRYFCTDYNNIKQAISELIDEYDAQD